MVYRLHPGMFSHSEKLRKMKKNVDMHCGVVLGANHQSIKSVRGRSYGFKKCNAFLVVADDKRLPLIL